MDGRARWESSASCIWEALASREGTGRGYRIEPGKVECAMTQPPDIAQCIVTADRGAHDEPLLTAYVVGVSPGRANEAALKGFLRSSLPEWMLPARIVELEALPLNANGKVDRRALAGIAALRKSPTAKNDLPLTPAERLIATLWSEIL